MLQREKPKEEAKTGNKQTSRINEKPSQTTWRLLLRTFFWLQILRVEDFLIEDEVTQSSRLFVTWDCM